MLRRGRISEGWLGELYAGEDAQGRSVRFISLGEYTEDNRAWVAERIRLMNTTAIQGSIPQLGIQIIQGEPCWIGAWRDAVQLSAVLESKHIPNTVIMAVAFGVLQSLHSAHQKGVVHGVLHPNGIWLGLDGTIWLDGYGHRVDTKHRTEHDIYLLGVVLIEMFLGTDAVPADGVLTPNHIRQFGMELQAMGLPNKLPKQILSLLHPDIAKRPSAELLVRKWKLTRAQAIVSSWVRTQFPSLQTAHRPEDRIPTSSRIAPLPFPLAVEASGSHAAQSLKVVLEDDDTMMQSRVHAEMDSHPSEEQTQTVHVESTEQTSQELPEIPEDTQEIQFASDFEADFFDAEPTSKLVVDAFFSDDQPEVAVEEVQLQDEMDDVAVRSRRPLMGLVWIGVVGVTLIGMLYMMIPSIPSYPDDKVDSKTEQKMDLKMGDDSDGIGSVKGDSLLEVAVPAVASQRTDRSGDSQPKSNIGRAAQTISSNAIEKSVPQPQNTPSSNGASKKVQRTTRTASTPQKGPSSSVKPSTSSSKETSPSLDRPQNGSSKPKQALQQTPEEQPKSTKQPSLTEKQETRKEATVKDAIVEEKKPVGTVRVTGDAESVRLEMNGRDVPLGEIAAGQYTVYATFSGFNEFKVSTMTVEDGGTYTVYCDSLFATCKIK